MICLPRCWWAWCFSFCSTRPSFGTMGTSMATPCVVRAGTAMPGVTRAGLARMSTRPGTMARARAAGGGRDGEGRGGWGVLAGEGVHCFGDGILIASAFMADIRLGVLAAVSVLVHEVPHHMGDLVVLCQTNPSQRIALLKVSLAGAVTVLGGVAGYFLVGQLQDFLPYFLVLASSSFVYVALADLIPQLQKRLTARATLIQIVWLLVGMALVTLVRALADRH